MLAAFFRPWSPNVTVLFLISKIIFILRRRDASQSARIVTNTVVLQAVDIDKLRQAAIERKLKNIGIFG